jgi:hypothetical protein
MKASFDDSPAPEINPVLPHVPPQDTRGLPKTQDWSKAVSAVTQASSRYGTALSHARLVQLLPGKACLAFAAQAGFHKNSVFGSGRSTIEKVLSEFFGSPIQLVEESAGHSYESAKPSLAEQQATLRESHTRKMETKVHTHPRIQSALSILEGQIEFIRTLEVSAPAPLTSFENTGEDND